MTDCRYSHEESSFSTTISFVYVFFSFFFLMRRRPPRSTRETTLFPYTTLFRSGVTVDGLRSKTRTKTLTTPRQIAMYLTRELLATQLVEIGNAFGGRDHSTVIHSLEKVQQDITQDSDLKSRINRLRNTLQTFNFRSLQRVETTRAS